MEKEAENHDKIFAFNGLGKLVDFRWVRLGTSAKSPDAISSGADAKPADAIGSRKCLYHTCGNQNSW